jgi:glutathione S-transferase
MQKVVTDSLRPPGAADPHGVAEARAAIRESYAFLESRLPLAPWAAGSDFSLADCAAAPALFYAAIVEPLGPGEPRLGGYLLRLAARPSFARVLREAEPYFGMFPLEPRPRIPG